MVQWEELEVDHGGTDLCASVRKKPVGLIVSVTNILSGQDLCVDV